MRSQPAKSCFVNHLSGLVTGEPGLPELPLPEELFWASKGGTNLPPTSYMLPEVVMASRLYLRTEILKLLEQARTKDLMTQISESDLPKIGLPNLPSEYPPRSESLANSTIKKLHSNDKRLFETSTEATKFSALYHYGVDDTALNKLLAATASLIDQMPSQSAVDCLMDMPVWMRNIFLARHGVSNMIGVLLAARLEDSGEPSILSSDGTIAALNKVGPEAVSFAMNLALPKMDTRSSPLARLTTSHVRRQTGISIKNPNIVVEQTPRIGRLKSASLL
jgi:hypothetical protein